MGKFKRFSFSSRPTRFTKITTNRKSKWIRTRSSPTHTPSSQTKTNRSRCCCCNLRRSCDPPSTTKQRQHRMSTSPPPRSPPQRIRKYNKQIQHNTIDMHQRITTKNNQHSKKKQKNTKNSPETRHRNASCWV